MVESEESPSFTQHSECGQMEITGILAKEKKSTGIDFGETYHLTVKCSRIQVTIHYHPQLLFLLLVPHCEIWLDSQILPNILEIPLTWKIKTYTSKQLRGNRDDSENKRQLQQWSQWLVLRHENKQINKKCCKKKDNKEHLLIKSMIEIQCFLDGLAGEVEKKDQKSWKITEEKNKRIDLENQFRNVVNRRSRKKKTGKKNK